MNLNVRLMTAPEIDLIINYFWRSTPEELETIGVDPTRLPDPEAWRRRFQAELMKPVEERANVLVSWLMEGQPIGFSTADKIVSANTRTCICTHPAGASKTGSRGGVCPQIGGSLFPGASAEAAVLRTERIQCSAQSNASEGRIQLPKEPHDCPWSSQFSSSGHPVGVGAAGTLAAGSHFNRMSETCGKRAFLQRSGRRGEPQLRRTSACQVRMKSVLPRHSSISACSTRRRRVPSHA